MSLYPNDDDKYARAKEVVRALGGQWHGRSGMARCPAHDDTNPSISVTQKNGRLLFYCHAGCSQHEVGSALESLRNRVGRVCPRRDNRLPSEDEGERESTQNALKIWDNSKPAIGTPVERYLRRPLCSFGPRQLVW